MSEQHIRVEQERLSQALALFRPSRPAFVTSKNVDASDHVAPFAWFNPASANPPRLSLSLQNERGRKLSHTLVNIRREREFALCLPCRGQERVLVQSSFMPPAQGSKLDRTGFSREQAQHIAAALIGEAIASLECRVVSIIDHGGDHDLILADIVAASYDPGYFTPQLKLRADRADLLFNVSEERFEDHQSHIFAQLGETFAFSVYYDE